ncbi:MAG: rhombosortase [Gammaproteobacteria bacterium]|nr:rhombosortase [Gammaproteobacteria bacterium]
MIHRSPIPKLTFLLVLVVTGLHALVPDRASLYFGLTEILDGEHWRAVSGHFVHVDGNHLGWNVLGLAVLGWLIERHSPALLAGALIAGVIAVNVLLIAPWTGLDYYCGLSGALNALLVVALWLEWRASPSPWIAAVAAACLAKVALEILTGNAVFSDIGWPPFAWSHLAGMAGGIVLLAVWWSSLPRPQRCKPSPEAV